MSLKEFNRNLKREYKDTFQNSTPKKKFQLKWRYAFGLAIGCLFLLLLIDHLYVQIYNHSIESYNEQLKQKYYEKSSESTSKLVKVTSLEEYQVLIKQNQAEYTLKSTKSSFLSTLFSLSFTGCTSGNVNDGMAPPDYSPGDSYQTNVQTVGIDEEDVAKCDGEYIYTIQEDSTLNVYNLKGEKIVSTLTQGNELLIYKNKVITLGETNIEIYSFEAENLTKIWGKTFDKFYTSRLKEDTLYVVIGFRNVEKELDYASCYYDKFSNLSWLQSVMKLNLNTLELFQTQSISSSEVYCYMSNSAVYLASYTCFLEPLTSISMYNEALEPVGAMRVRGNLLNQFSMDEYENHLRVVSTDVTQNAEELNRITIFNIQNEIQETGCLKSGIGMGRQVIKSVRFNKNICYVVTYEITDPLYEIDCSDPKNPIIVSSYKAPGYSSYLHTFTIEEKEYILGLGYTDSGQSTKISLYRSTTQIGNDFIISQSKYYDKPDFIGDIDLNMFHNHKALFFYQSNNTLYLGARVEYDSYVFFEIQVDNEEEPIHIMKRLDIPFSKDNYSRAFLVNGQLYLTTSKGLDVYEKER